jgi:hypothetical protein
MCVTLRVFHTRIQVTAVDYWPDACVDVSGGV